MDTTINVKMLRKKSGCQNAKKKLAKRYNENGLSKEKTPSLGNQTLGHCKTGSI